MKYFDIFVERSNNKCINYLELRYKKQKNFQYIQQDSCTLEHDSLPHI